MPTPKTASSKQKKELERRLNLLANNSTYGLTEPHMPCTGPAKVISGRTIKNKIPVNKLPKTTEDVDSKYFTLLCTGCYKTHEIYFESNVTFIYGEIDKSHETEYKVPIDNSGLIEEFIGTHRCSCGGYLKIISIPELSNIVSMFALKGYKIYNVGRSNYEQKKRLYISMNDGVEFNEEDISRLPEPWKYIDDNNSIEIMYYEGIDNLEYHIGKLEDWISNHLSRFKG